MALNWIGYTYLNIFANTSYLNGLDNKFPWEKNELSLFYLFF